MASKTTAPPSGVPSVSIEFPLADLLASLPVEERFRLAKACCSKKTGAFNQKQAAEYLGVSVPTFRKLNIASVIIGGCMKWLPEDLDTYRFNLPKRFGSFRVRVYKVKPEPAGS